MCLHSQGILVVNVVVSKNNIKGCLLYSFYLGHLAWGDSRWPGCHSQLQNTSYLLCVNIHQVVETPSVFNLLIIQILEKALVHILSVLRFHFKSLWIWIPSKDVLSTMVTFSLLSKVREGLKSDFLAELNRITLDLSLLIFILFFLKCHLAFLLLTFMLALKLA